MKTDNEQYRVSKDRFHAATTHAGGKGMPTATERVDDGLSAEIIELTETLRSTKPEHKALVTVAEWCRSGKPNGDDGEAYGVLNDLEIAIEEL